MNEQRKMEFEALLHEHRSIVFKVANTYCWQTEDRAELAQEIARRDAATYSNAAKNFSAEVLLNASACQAPKER